MLIPINLRPKFIEGFDKEYGATRSGQVYSFIRGKFLQQIKNSRGQYQVRLCKDGKPAQYVVHRLVAQLFIPNPNNLPQVNHKDEDKTNNIVDNLEWCDSKYNNNYGTLQQRRIQTNINNGKYSEPIKRKEHRKEYFKKYHNENREHIREYQREYRKRKRGQ